jgi:hypothetical protein
MALEGQLGNHHGGLDGEMMDDEEDDGEMMMDEED